MNTIKRYAAYTALVVFAFSIWYLGAAFITLEINFIDWKQSTRELVFLGGGITAIGAMIVYQTERLYKQTN